MPPRRLFPETVAMLVPPRFLEGTYLSEANVSGLGKGSSIQRISVTSGEGSVQFQIILLASFVQLPRTIFSHSALANCPPQGTLHRRAFLETKKHEIGQ